MHIYIRYLLISLSIIIINPLSADGLQQQSEIDVSLSDPLLDLESMTVEELVQLVLRRNPTHHELTEAINAAQASVLPAGSLDDPQLSYGIAPVTMFGGSDRFGQSIEISQAIPWPGTLALREQQAGYHTDMAEYHLQDHELEMIMAVKAAFAEYLYVYRSLAINQETQTLINELKNIAEGHYMSGRASQQDVLKAEVELASLEERAMMLQRQQKQLQAQINALIDRPAHKQLPLPLHETQVISPPDSDTLIDIAVEQHPHLMQLQALVNSRTTEIDLVDKRFYPDIRIQAGYNNMWNNPDMRFMVGLSINLPLDREKRRAERDAASASAREARWQMIDQRNHLLASLEQARVGVEESVRVLALYEQRLLPLADENLAVAEADYRAGDGLFINVIDAEQNQLDIQLRLERAHADYIRRRAELERWIGEPLAAHERQEVQS